MIVIVRPHHCFSTCQFIPAPHTTLTHDLDIIDMILHSITSLNNITTKLEKPSTKLLFDIS